MAQASPKPLPYQSPVDPNCHRGVVSVTGSKTVDLGLGHNNFYVVLNLKGGLTDQNKAPVLSWAYGTKKGTFTIQAGKFTAAGDTTIIAATSAVDVQFNVEAGASVE